MNLDITDSDRQWCLHSCWGSDVTDGSRRYIALSNDPGELLRVPSGYVVVGVWRGVMILERGVRVDRPEMALVWALGAAVIAGLLLIWCGLR